jgi:hypothetical protein
VLVVVQKKNKEKIMTNANITTLNWMLPEVGDEGRFATITDGEGGQCYVAALPDGDGLGNDYTLADAISDFSSTYDAGEADGNIKCRAVLTVDGEETDSQQFEIEV